MKVAEKYHIILASGSPRRRYLLEQIGLRFEVRAKETDESFPPELHAEQIPLYLCRVKAHAFKEELKKNELLITADTIVWINGQVLNKPVDEEDAFRMLKMLSGDMHEVFTGVCLASPEKEETFFVSSRVFFRKMSDEELRSYIRDCRPFDKAGAYGAQESMPPGIAPCSPEEAAFLVQIGKTHLNSIEKKKGGNKRGYILVDRIEGSYFNVMGLPLRELYAALAAF